MPGEPGQGEMPPQSPRPPKGPSKDKPKDEWTQEELERFEEIQDSPLSKHLRRPQGGPFTQTGWRATLEDNKTKEEEPGQGGSNPPKTP